MANSNINTDVNSFSAAKATEIGNAVIAVYDFTETPTDTTYNAQEFEELTHAATNIVLIAENDGDIYRRYVETLIGLLAKKVAKGIQLNASTLAASSVVANIIRESIKGMKSNGWVDPITASDRKQAAYLASVDISEAIENAEYINA